MKYGKAGWLGTVCAGALLGAGMSGCMTIRTEHEVEPIYVTVDVNLRVERELDDFFGSIDEQAETVDYGGDGSEAGEVEY